MLEARIVQLEQTLRVLVTTLQQQQLQLHSQNQMHQQQDGQHQQLDDGNDHKPGHTREGSDVSSYLQFMHCMIKNTEGKGV